MNANTTPANSLDNNRRYKLAKLISKGYLVGALGISFSHFIHAFNKLGLYGFDAVTMPIAVDGLALFGVLLQTTGPKGFSKRTNTIGRWLQLVCGSLSLMVNIFSGWGSPGAMIQGATWVIIYMMMELIVSRIKPSSADTNEAAEAAAAAAQAIIDAASAFLATCNHPTTCKSADQCTAKKAAAQKRNKTVARKARQAKAEQKVLESMMN